MSLSPDFIAQAKALAFARKFKFRRDRHVATAAQPRYWEKIGYGYFGEAWAHKDHPNLVVKISGRAGFGSGVVPTGEPCLDGWPTFAEYCFANPHPNLPKIMHFERLSLGVSFGIMPRYEKIDPRLANAADVLSSWEDYLEGDQGAPAWMWPIIGMRGALNVQVDLHSDNVMWDPATGEYIMTDPFSGVDESYYYS